MMSHTLRWSPGSYATVALLISDNLAARAEVQTAHLILTVSRKSYNIPGL
jgi:hypothetical protein